MLLMNINSIYGYNTINVDEPASYVNFHPQFSGCQVGSKYVYAIISGTTLYVYVFTDDSLYGEVEISGIVTSSPYDLRIYEFNSSYAIIIVTGYSGNYFQYDIIGVNLNTLSYQKIDDGYTNLTEADKYTNIGIPIKTDNDTLRFIIFAKIGSTNYKVKVTYTLSTNSISQEVAEANYQGYIYGFNQSDTVYFIATSTSNPNKTVALKYVTSTDTLTELAQEPSTSYVNNEYMRYIGGGIYHNETDDIYILYHSWITGSENNIITFKLWRLKFQTSIEPANLLTQKLTTLTFTLAYQTYPNYWNVLSGYVENRTIYHIYTMYYSTSESKYKPIHYKIQFTDWYNLNSGETEINTDYPSELMFICPQNPETYAWRFITSNYEHTDDGENIIIYSDLLPLVRIYTLSLTYTPLEEPPKSYTNYLFTVSSTRNGEAYDDGIVTVYIDDTKYKVLELTDGKATFTYYTTIAGYHNFTIILTDLGEEVKTLTKTYLFISGEPSIEENPLEVTEMMVNLMTTILPFLIIVLLPAIIMAYYTKDTYGFIAGLTLGIIMGYTSGLLPTYALFLFALVLVLIVYRGLKG